MANLRGSATILHVRGSHRKTLEVSSHKSNLRKRRTILNHVKRPEASKLTIIT
jgi:hypothetical protein